MGESRLTARQMRRLRLSYLPPRKRRKAGRFSRDELLDFLRSTGIHSPKKLMELRKEGDPLPSVIRREFGSWRAATREAFGPPSPLRPGVDREYLVRTALMLGIRTFDQYIEARKRDPGVVASIYWVRKNYANAGAGRRKGKARFSLFMCDVTSRRFPETQDAYAKIWRRLGRAPTLEDCRKAGVDIGVLLEKHVFHDKRDLDRHMARLEEVRRRHERQGRGS